MGGDGTGKGKDAMGGTGAGGDNADGGRVLTMIAEWMPRIESKLDTAIADIRAEMHAGDEARVSKEAWTEYDRAIQQRLQRLEDSPMKVLAWLGFVCGLVGGPLLTVVLFIVLHH